jgi:hypothetical protein
MGNAEGFLCHDIHIVKLGCTKKIMFSERMFQVLEPAGVLVVSRKIITTKAFDNDNTQLYNPSDSEGDNIANYLNITYYDTFTSDEKTLIKNSTLYIGNETN